MESSTSGNDASPFIPGQCLFCSKSFPSLDDSIIHMQKFHGLFIPSRQHLVVDIDTLLKYLHLVIFGYRECIQCGTERASVQAVQQHMTGKGHCTFDISDPDSEFAEFYDFSAPTDENEKEDFEDDGDDGIPQASAPSSIRKPLHVDEDFIRLPSGKIISRQASAQSSSSLNPLLRRVRSSNPRRGSSLVKLDKPEEDANPDTHNPDNQDSRLLSRREKRERAATAFQLTSMRANDRSSLMHLPTSQQRALLATQHRHEEKVQKEESRRRGKVDRKGNKNLYAYWHTETPVYTCG